MAKLANISQEKLVEMYLEVEQEASILSEKYEDLESRRSRVNEILEDLLPLIGSIFTAIVNIRAIIRLIRDILRAIR